MAITPLPTPPSRSQSPATFSTDADAFLGALPDFATEANALAADVNADEASAAASATTATNAASIAVGAANYQGAYSAGVTYQIGQSVSSGGRQWVAKTVNTGITPVEGANWLLINDGDVLGPVSAVNNALALYDGTTGKIIKGGINNGTAGQALISGGAGNAPVWQSVGGTLNDTFTAVAGITAGKVVQYTTGTNVEQIAGSVTAYSISLGTGVNAGTPSNQNRSRVGISPDGTTAVALVGKSSVIEVRIGAISGSTVTWGTAVSLTISGATANSFRPGQISFINGSNTEFIIVAYDGSGTTNNGIVCYFGVISGTTATFTRSIISAGTQSITAINSVHYTTNSVCVFYLISTTMSGIPFTFSGTTITAGSVTSVATSVNLSVDTQHIACDFDPLTTGQIVVGYNGASANFAVRLVRVTASGPSLSAGSPFNGSSTTDGLHDIAFDKRVANRLYNTFKLAGYIYTYTATISGSTITASGSNSNVTPTGVVGDDNPYIIKMRCLPVSANFPPLTRLVTNYTSISTSTGTLTRSVLTQELSNDTTNPVYSTVQNTAFGSPSGNQNVFAISTFGKFALMNEAGNSSTDVSIGQAPFTYIVSNLNDAKIVGIASNTVTTGQLVTVDLLGGYNRNQAGLTNWTVYYVDVTGALTTTSTAPNVKIGKSTSATAIQIKAPTI